MRNLRRRSNSLRLFTSKPRVKFSNDKIIINVFTYDRNSKPFYRKIFAFRKSMSLFKSWINNSNLKWKKLKLTRKTIFKYSFLERKFRKKILMINKKNNFSKKTSFKKFKSNKKLKNNKFKLNRRIKFRRNRRRNLKKIYANTISNYYGNKENKLLSLFISKLDNNLLNDIELRDQFNNGRAIYDRLAIPNIISYYNNNLSNNSSAEEKLLFSNLTHSLQFLLLKENFYLWKREIFRSFKKVMLNRLRFGEYTSKLKILINKLYNKKVEVNLVNLKYPHLNSDIFNESLVIKLRKISLNKIIKRCLRLVKLPKTYLFDKRVYLNKLDRLNTLKSVKTNVIHNNIINTKYKDVLDNVLNRIYPKRLFKLSLKRVGRMTILNSIKYKWISGMRIEAAGRLSRRFTASRSLFKLKYKGSLRNIDYKGKSDSLDKSVSLVMLRNHVKANSQFTLGKSKKRTGAFGIKTWLSSY